MQLQAQVGASETGSDQDDAFLVVTFSQFWSLCLFPIISSVGRTDRTGAAVPFGSVGSAGRASERGNGPLREGG